MGVAVRGQQEGPRGDGNVCLLTVPGQQPSGVMSYRCVRYQPRRKWGKGYRRIRKSVLFLTTGRESTIISKLKI